MTSATFASESYFCNGGPTKVMPNFPNSSITCWGVIAALPLPGSGSRTARKGISKPAGVHVTCSRPRVVPMLRNECTEPRGAHAKAPLSAMNSLPSTEILNRPSST